jgi:hypothetical protein
MSVSSGTPFDIRAKMGAGFVGGGPSPILNPRKMSLHGYSGSPRYSADSMFSIYTGAARYGEEFDDEGAGIEDEEGEDMLSADDILLEQVLKSVNRSRYLIELSEKILNSDDDIEDDDDDIEEFSGAGAAGGYTGLFGGSQKNLDDQRELMQKLYNS